ncbi:hypothetical protein [Protofrankia sp. BMG5.30]|uniref:hypothetical protein n=1 Tax=Protofrankia sp. BMG5.30 TaxID=1834514 RepID=UPI0009760F31|nr:hypothetical protein [Protofrankia sp. BMG5.30]ONH32212.1 hypothetical protein BL254_22105 [Protofrankia sp. BMG5.30]
MAEGGWRNLPVYRGGGPNGSGMWYEEPDYGTVEFTPAASGDGSDGEPIEVIRRRIMNQHPEDISALADQWQNAYNLLSSIRQQLLDQSNILYEQAWRSARARDAFMEKGPGEALAYLQDWMDAALDNVNGLRALVDIAQRSRADMENLWNRYQSEIEDASNADGWTRFGQGFLTGASLGFYDGEAGVQKSEQEAVRKKQQEFNKLAQELAFNVGNQYGETFSTLGGGHGALFRPMNAVLNTVGHPPFPTIGAGPSSLGGPAGGPGAAPTITPPNALSNPPLPTPGAPPFQPADVTPPVAPGQVPVPTGQLNSQPDVAPPPAANPVFSPVALPAALVAPPPAANRASRPAGAPAVTPPPGLPAAAAAPAVAKAAPNAANAALRSPSALSRLSTGTKINASGLNSGLIQARGSGTPTAGATPGALRSPAAAPPPTGGRGPREKQPPGASRREPQGPGVKGPLEEPFSGTPAGTAPPVLNNQRPAGQRRPGSRGEPHPTARARPGTPAPPRPAGAAPPVLNSPGTSPTHAPPPAPTRPNRPGRDAPARPGLPGQPGRPAPGSEWAGAQDARADASAPVLDAPVSPPTGAAVSGLEETRLRGRTATTPAVRSRPGSAVASELTARRARPVGMAPAQGQDAHADEDQRIVTDDEAFSVDTPGGSVVTKKPEDRSYRAEPPSALGRGG